MMLSLYSAMTFPHTTLSLALTAFLVLIISFQSDIGESVVVVYTPPLYNNVNNHVVLLFTKLIDFLVHLFLSCRAIRCINLNLI
jgi:hypothetical protein